MPGSLSNRDRNVHTEYLALYVKMHGVPPWEDPLNEDEYVAPMPDFVEPVERKADCHPDRKHHAKGLCLACYDKQRKRDYRKRKLEPRAPYARIPPCHPDRKHHARNLCHPCYNKEKRRRARQNSDKGQTKSGKWWTELGYKAPSGSKKKQGLPIEPLREWLLARKDRYDTMKEFADKLGIHDKRLRNLMQEQKHVSIEVVDEILTREGSTMLWELYPDA